MKFEKSEAMKIKYRALCWLRLDQRCAFIATEVGCHGADILGVNEKKMIEVEAKVTLIDFKNDFRKGKHYAYANSVGMWVPNIFYFAVPSELVEPCKKILQEKDSKYGLIDADEWRVIKRAKKIHDKEPSSKAKFRIALRMGSELLRFHEAWL